MGITRLTNWLRPSRKARKANRLSENNKLKTERLEEREAPAIYTVTWDGFGAQPGGTLSLQQAIDAANASVDSTTLVGDVIDCGGSQFGPDVFSDREQYEGVAALGCAPPYIAPFADRLRSVPTTEFSSARGTRYVRSSTFSGSMSGRPDVWVNRCRTSVSSLCCAANSGM